MDVFQVAEWFLSCSRMTHKKLQKLCYYGQGWHMALEGCPLFGEKRLYNKLCKKKKDRRTILWNSQHRKECRLAVSY